MSSEYVKERNAKQKIQLLAKNKMRYFLRKAFAILNPSAKLKWNWHLDYLCDILEEVACGKIKRLIINIPPRYLKSVICSVCFPAWLLGKNPKKRIIVASYSKALAIKHSTDTRRLMMSRWYVKNFPKTKIANGENEKNKFCTTDNGFRFATSVNGTLTGEGGDVLIVDDPHNPVNIHSKISRKRTINWFSSVFMSRLNNKNEGSVVIVMQRLHTDDLVGYLLEKENQKNNKNQQKEWFLVSLPAIAESEYDYFLFNKFYKKRKIGDVLHPTMESFETLMKIKADLGEYNFEAQYQQQPVALSGNMIKKSWLHYFDLSEFSHLYNYSKNDYYISVDCASGIGTENDFTAIAVFVVMENKFYLYDMFRLKIAYPELKQKILEISKKYTPKVILIEDKSNGSSLIQDLKKSTSINVVAIKPTKSKECRVNDVLSTFEAGRLLIAKNQSWQQELEIELLSFPHCKHDDQVDSISQFINWHNSNQWRRNSSPKIRRL